MLFFDGDGRVVASRRQPGDAAFGWWLADWAPPCDASGVCDVPADALSDAFRPDSAAAAWFVDGDGVSCVDYASDDSQNATSCTCSDSQCEPVSAWSTSAEADSGVCSGETSLGAATSLPPTAPATTPAPRTLLRLLRTPEHEASAEELRVAEAQRQAHARIDSLRADARELLRDARRLREQMQACDAQAQNVRGGARRLSEELRETRHLDAVLQWLRAPPPDVAVAALPDDSPARDRHSALPRRYSERTGTPMSCHLSRTAFGVQPFRRHRSEGDLRPIGAPCPIGLIHERTNSRSAPSNIHLLPTDFEETYYDIDPRTCSKNGRCILLPQNFEMHAEVESRQQSRFGSCSSSSVSEPVMEKCRIDTEDNVDVGDEGLGLIRGRDETIPRDCKNSSLHNTTEQQDSTMNYEDECVSSDDDWSIISYHSNSSDEAAASQRKPYIDLRPAIFREHSIVNFLNPHLALPRPRLDLLQEPRNRSPVAQAVGYRIRGRCVTVPEDFSGEEDYDDFRHRAITPVLNRGYSV